LGTSANHPSPNTPTWKLAKAVVGREDVPVHRQASEIWRAALGDRAEALKGELASGLIGRAAAIADSAKSPSVAVRQLEQLMLESRSTGLTVEVAKRALARAVAGQTGARGFAAELFAEATSYYVSRDLPSYVAGVGRVATTSGAIQLKAQLRSVAMEAASSRELASTDAAGWRRYVNRVVDDLTKKKSR
jgi:hypothetical protein